MEEIVYRGYGPHQRKGGGFSSLGVRSETELEAALADGWYRTLPEAIEAHDRPKASLPGATITVGMSGPLASVPSDDAPPTRAELETQAKELGLKFDRRTSDRKLGRMIDDALKA